jgi:anti-anti-sigma factor
MLSKPGLHLDTSADRTTTIRLSGEVGADNLDALRRAVDDAAGSAPLIVDLTDVAYIDTAGVALLVEAAAERALEIVLGPGCAVFPVIQVSGLDQVATIRSPR